MSFCGFFNLASGGLLKSFSGFFILNEECQHLPFAGGFSSVESSKIITVYPLRRNQDPAPRLHCCFLTASPVPLHPLHFQISNSGKVT